VLSRRGLIMLDPILIYHCGRMIAWAFQPKLVRNSR
jgi:hypothetical protein